MDNDDWKAAKKQLPKALYLRQWTIKQASHAIPLDTLETVLRCNGSLHDVHFTSPIPWVKCATLTIRMQAYLQRNQRTPELLVANLQVDGQTGHSAYAPTLSVAVFGGATSSTNGCKSGVYWYFDA
jgi:hypothetical protein